MGNIIGNGFVGLNRVWGGGFNADSPAPPSTFNPTILLDAYTAGYTVIGPGTTNFIDTISGTGISLNNIYHYDSNYMETPYCAALRSDTTLTQIPTSYFRIESNGGVVYSPDYPCTNVGPAYLNQVYGWDSPAYNSLNVNVTNGFTAIVVARKLDIGTDTGNQPLLTLAFDYNTFPNPTAPKYLQMGFVINDSVAYNRWCWNDDGQGNGSLNAGLQNFDTSKFTFSAIASGTNNLSNTTDVYMTDGLTSASGGGITGAGENVTATTLNNAVFNRNTWETTYGISVFQGQDWDFAAVIFFDYKLTPLQIQRIYNYYKVERGYNMY